ncbi:MAG TPA: SRPBCC family protein [Pseudonocardiaceae bacterium]|jgi:uncharacterized protein YndB with AHSA1/START domain|nr:SRPBCC family protein [Pseudonocardiaceae bacterium]
MTTLSVKHTTFTLERVYPVSPSRVFAAWADPAAKARWLGGPVATHHELDFRVGGREIVRGRHEGGPELTFESHYQDIVPDERIVFASTMRTETDLATVSVTTVELEPAATIGTRLLLTQYSAFLDGHEEPAWREQGTGDQLTALGRELEQSDDLA